MKTIYTVFLLCIMAGNIALSQNSNLDSRYVNKDDNPIKWGADTLNLPFRSITNDNFSGTVSVIKGEDLNATDVNLTSSLKGKAAGLYITEIPGAHRESSYNISIRGLNTQSFENTTPLIIVDGLERPLSYIQPEDVEQITILKDAVAKSFFKGKAANGVILVKTKRGSTVKNSRRIQVETGLSQPTRLPVMLGSAEYAQYYNLARRNSNMPDLYTDADINAYKNGASTLKYPSNNYYDELLKDQKNYTKASATFMGGSDALSYFLSTTYLHNGGLEGVGYPNALDQFTLRSNLDFKVSNTIKAFLDIYGFLDSNNTNYLQPSELFSRLSSQRPNEYATILRDNVDPDSVLYGSGRYGTAAAYQNTYAEMLLGGVRKNTQRIGQMNIGFTFDLSSLAKGLQAKTGLSFDTYNYVSVGKNDNFYSYMPEWNNNDISNYVLVTVGNKNSNMATLASDGYKKYSLSGQLDYSRIFDKSDLNAHLVFFGDQTEYMYVKEINKSQSNTLLLNYLFDKRIVADLNVGLLGSSKLPENNRYGFFPAAGLGWIISNEEFFPSNKSIDYLKLKASYGISGSDDGLNYFSYLTRWNYINAGTYYTYFGTDARTVANTTTINSYQNPAIDWEKSNEFNVGIETMFLKDFGLNINYYHMYRTNIPIYEDLLYSQIAGITGKQINFASIKNNGVDAELSYFKQQKDWSINVSVNANYSLSRYVKSASWQDLPAGRNLDGKVVDAYIGLVSNGIIKDVNALAKANQGFGEVGLGDLGYEDMNGDGIVDQKDMKEIGNSFPRIQYGANLSFIYKNIGFSVSGYGAGMYKTYLDNRYYRPMPEMGYTAHVRESYNPETGTGTYPRLSMTNSSNNYRLSDFWLRNGSFFKVKDIEISYSFPQSIYEKVSLNSLRLFVKGNNIATFSQIKDVDPEYINAGITSYPFMRTFNVGFNLTF